MALTPFLRIIGTIFCSHDMWYLYCCTIEPLTFLWLNIGPDTHIYIQRDSDSVSWLSINSRKKALLP